MTGDRFGYQDVKTQVLARIREGFWESGVAIPSEIDLADEFGCARATVNRAMRELADEGYLDRRRKAGTFINPAPKRQAKFSIPLIREEIEATGAAYRYSMVSREIADAPGWLSARLALEPRKKLLQLQCVHFAGNRVFQFENRWINTAVVPAAADESFQNFGPNEWLVKAVPFTDVEISFSAVPAPASAAEYLGVLQNTALFFAERVTWLEQEPVTLAQLYFAPGYQMTTRA